MLQSSKSAAQESTSHCPLTQPAVPFWATHSLPHAPQLRSSSRRLASHVCPTPSQLPVFTGQFVEPQVPFAQNGEPAPAGQTLPQEPQLLTAVSVLRSQPFAGSLSQSSNGAVHVMPQSPPVHVAVP